MLSILCLYGAYMYSSQGKIPHITRPMFRKGRGSLENHGS